MPYYKTIRLTHNVQESYIYMHTTNISPTDVLTNICITKNGLHAKNYIEI